MLLYIYIYKIVSLLCNVYYPQCGSFFFSILTIIRLRQKNHFPSRVHPEHHVSLNVLNQFLPSLHHTIYYYYWLCSIISWYEVPKHIFLSMPDLSDFSMFYGSHQLFIFLDVMPKSFQAIKIVEIFPFL